MSQLTVAAASAKDVVTSSRRRGKRPNVPGVVGTIFTLIMAAIWFSPSTGLS